MLKIMAVSIHNLSGNLFFCVIPQKKKSHVFLILGLYVFVVSVRMETPKQSVHANIEHSIEMCMLNEKNTSERINPIIKQHVHLATVS